MLSRFSKRICHDHRRDATIRKEWLNELHCRLKSVTKQRFSIRQPSLMFPTQTEWINVVLQSTHYWKPFSPLSFSLTICYLEMIHEQHLLMHSDIIITAHYSLSFLLITLHFILDISSDIVQKTITRTQPSNLSAVDNHSLTFFKAPNFCFGVLVRRCWLARRLQWSRDQTWASLGLPCLLFFSHGGLIVWISVLLLLSCSALKPETGA